MNVLQGITKRSIREIIDYGEIKKSRDTGDCTKQIYGDEQTILILKQF